jgi:hypothetical protein
VKHTLILFKASALLQATFGDKSFNAKFKAVACFMKKHDYVYRCAINEATRAPAEVYEDAHSFLEEVRPILLGPHRDRCWIFNMDQTPLNFSYHSLRMLEKRGKKPFTSARPQARQRGRPWHSP